jgi:lysozyme family protein
MTFLQRLSTFGVFGKGWTARVKGVRKLALEMAAAAPAGPVQPAPPIPAPTPATDDKRPWWAVLFELIINFFKGLRK